MENVKRCPGAVGFGVGGRAEIFGNWATITRIDRDSRPLFFPSTPGGSEAGTGGGILVDYPLVRQQWFGSKVGDLTVGGKINLTATKKTPVGAAVLRRSKW